MLYKNEVCTVTVTDINNLGYGVARIDGMVVFIAQTVTGDTAEIKIIKTTSAYCVGKLIRIIVPSPFRASDACTVSGRCGGCIYSGITYELELELKKNYVRNAFKKAGVDAMIDDVVTTGKYTGYRNKLQYPVSADFKLGYYANKSHTIVPHDSCLLHPQVMTKLANAAATLLCNSKADVYDETSGRGLVRHIYIRHAETTDELMLCIVINGREIPEQARFVSTLCREYPQLVSIQLNVNTKPTNVVLGDEFITIYGRDYIIDHICGLEFKITAPSFYQINRETAELLYRDAAGKAELHDGELLVDLFCGIGTIGLSVIAGNENLKLVGVEIVPSAVECARFNASANNINNAEFICGDANIPEIKAADVVILDPPRKGCSASLIKKLMEIAPSKIVYISCDPDTLARDIRIFIENGYKNGAVTPYDMFPRTGHVESIVLLSHKKADSYINVNKDFG